VSWSQDGQWVSYFLFPTGLDAGSTRVDWGVLNTRSGQIATRELGKSALKYFQIDGQLVSEWSPDGRTIAMVGTSGTAKAGQLYLRSDSALKSIDLPDLNYAQLVRWSPDGQLIAIIGHSTQTPGRGLVLFYQPKDGKLTSILSRMDTDSRPRSVRNDTLVWAPNSRAFYVEGGIRDGDDFNGWDVYDAGGSAWFRLTNEYPSIAWRSDSTLLYRESVPEFPYTGPLMVLEPSTGRKHPFLDRMGSQFWITTQAVFYLSADGSGRLTATDLYGKKQMRVFDNVQSLKAFTPLEDMGVTAIEWLEGPQKNAVRHTSFLTLNGTLLADFAPAEAIAYLRPVQNSRMVLVISNPGERRADPSNVYLLNLESGERRLLFSLPDGLIWRAYVDPSDSFVHVGIYHGIPTTEWLFTRSGGLTPASALADFQMGVVSPANRSMVQWEISDSSSPVTLMREDGSRATIRQSDDVSTPSNVVWSADGRYFALVLWSSGQQTTVEIYTAEGTRVQTLSLRDDTFSFSRIQWTDCS